MTEVALNALADTIRNSITAVVRSHGMDVSPGLLDEMARNAAQTVGYVIDELVVSGLMGEVSP